MDCLEGSGMKKTKVRKDTKKITSKSLDKRAKTPRGSRKPFQQKYFINELPKR
jgi:hypothetical protein